MKSMKFIGIYAGIIIAIFSVIAVREGWFTMPTSQTTHTVNTPTNFKECVAAGFPVQESYPRQCRLSSSTVYTEYIGNELEKSDLIVVETPRPNTVVEKTFTVTGQARGYWYFEASFPVILLDAQGNELVTSIAQAQDEWMTEDFVPFSVQVQAPILYTGDATLVLRKDNPSGETKFDDQLEIPITISQ